MSDSARQAGSSRNGNSAHESANESARPTHDLSALRIDDEHREPPKRRGLIALLLLPLVAAAVFLVPRLPLPWLVPQVETATVQRVTSTQAQTVLTATGYTYARTRAAVGAKIIGRVVELPVEEGDRLRRGDVIAVLDSDDLAATLRQAQAALAEAEARQADAEREEGRQRRLVEAGVNAQASFDASETQLAIARASVDTARANIEAIEARLEYTVIRSPIDGVVIERNVEVGEMVAPGGFTTQQSTGSIVRLADPSSLEVEADVNEAYISRLRLEMPASIEVDAVPDRQYRGKLRQIVPTGDRQRAVVEVKVTIDDGDERLVPDMSCTVTFLEQGTDQAQLDAAPKLLVPASTLLHQSGLTYVYVVEGDTLAKTLVELAEDDENTDASGMVEVVSGVNSGDVLVRAPTPELTDGMKIRLPS